MIKLTFVIFCSLMISRNASAQIAQFKGYSEISIDVGTRIGENGNPIPMGNYIPSKALLSLLGEWSSDFGSEHVYQNGLPNSGNMLIYYLVLNAFAEDIANQCDRSNLKPDRFALDGAFEKTLASFCAWPAPSAQTENVMSDFWIGVMGYDAPEEEFEAWRYFFTTSGFRSRPAHESVKAMTLALTMNPYFLLKN